MNIKKESDYLEFTKAKEVLNAIEKLDPNSTSTILEALKIAEHIETASGEFYRKETEKTKGTELEAFFAFLIKEEDMHLAKIKELEGLLKKGTMQKVSFSKNTLPNIHPVSVGQGEMTAILYGLWREKKAVEFYSEAAKKTNGAVKSFFEELAEFEKGHVELFEHLVEGMQNVNELIMG